MPILMPILRRFPIINAPDRLIDPEGEGAYFRADSSWSLRTPAFDFFADARRWSDLDIEAVWMREGADDLWYRSRWFRRYVLLPTRRCPVVPYAYVTPKPDAP